MTSFIRFGAGAILAGAMLSGVSGASAQVQSAHPAFEGVWKIATSPTTLLPHSAVPFTAKGRKEYDNNKKLKARRAYDDYDITISRCSSPGVPRLMLTPMRFKIWDRIGFVTFDFEWNRAIRQIDLRTTVTNEPGPFGDDLVPTMTGDSRGKWEGDMLVDPNTLENRVTIDDPEYYSKPWDAVITYKRQPDAIFPEDVCLDRIEAKKPAFPKP